jgi:hypothetical protein
MPRRPARPSAALATEVARLLRLWRRRDFQRANLALIREAIPVLARLGGTPGPEWDAFVEQRMVPFAQQWQAWPAIDWGLVVQDPRHVGALLTVFTGRWGVVPVFPWTTDAELRHAARRIRRRIGSRHRDAWTHQRAVLSRWLETNGIPRRAIPRLLGWRQGGTDRPTAAAVVAPLSVEQEQALMRDPLQAGLSHQAAEQRVLRHLRGAEAPAAGMVRKAQARHDAWLRTVWADLIASTPTDPVSFALTRLLRARYLTGDLGELGRAMEALGQALDQALRPASRATRGASRPRT